MLSIVSIRVRSDDERRSVGTYALLDTGSTTSLYTKALVDRLKPHVADNFTELQGVNSLRSPLVQVDPLKLKGLEEHEAYQVQSLVIVNTLPNMKRHLPLDDMKQKYKHLQDLNFGKPDSCVVEMLLGMNAQEVFRTSEQRLVGLYSGPGLVRT